MARAKDEIIFGATFDFHPHDTWLKFFQRTSYKDSFYMLTAKDVALFRQACAEWGMVWLCRSVAGYGMHVDTKRVFKLTRYCCSDPLVSRKQLFILNKETGELVESTYKAGRRKGWSWAEYRRKKAEEAGHKAAAAVKSADPAISQPDPALQQGES